MYKEDILRAAQGHIIRQYYRYVVEVADGHFTLVEKTPIRGVKEDLVCTVVYTVADVKAAKSPEFDAFLERCKDAPCTNIAREKSKYLNK